MAYDDGMAQKPELVALTKCDALTPELVADQKAQLSGLIKGEIIDISSVSGDGLQALYDKLISMIDADSDAAKDTKTTSQSTTAGWHPLRGSGMMRAEINQADLLVGENRLGALAGRRHVEPRLARRHSR